MNPTKCPHCGKPINLVDGTKEAKLKKIQDNFYDSLIEFVAEFGKETIREFYDYWSEPNKSKTKIRWQLERTWDTKRRLQRWQRTSNEKNRRFNNKGFESDSTKRTIESTVQTLREESK